MKQFRNPSFETAASEALSRAIQHNNVTKVAEAVNRASRLIALSPEKVEEYLTEKFNSETSRKV